MPDIWVTPRVWLAGERVTATKMNEISTNLRALFPHTAGGDTSYRDPAGAYLSRLAKGAALQSYRMKSDGTIPEWGGYIAGRVIRVSNQSINTGATPTNVQFTSAYISQGGVTWSGGDPTKLSIGLTGLYMIGLTYVFEAAGSGYREANIKKNGSTGLLASRIPTTGVVDYGPVPGAPPEPLAAGDYLQMEVAQTCGVPLNLQAASLYAVFVGV